MSDRHWILILDDDEAVASTLAATLDDAGYGVVTTTTAVNAYQMLQKQKFACLVIDLNLSQGSGTEVILALKADLRHPNHLTPVLLISGHLSQPILKLVGKQISG